MRDNDMKIGWRDGQQRKNISETDAIALERHDKEIKNERLERRLNTNEALDKSAVSINREINEFVHGYQGIATASSSNMDVTY